MTEIPKSLLLPPIVEAIAEIRFTPAPQISADSLLTGALHLKFKEQYSKMERTPFNQIPPQMRMADAELKFKPLVTLAGTNKVLLIGEHSLSIAFTAPYPGWTEFFSQISQVFNCANQSGAISVVDRISLKYVNFIPDGTLSAGLASTTISLSLGGVQIGYQPTHIRSEISSGTIVNVLQVLTGARLTLDPETTKTGVVIDIDTIQNGPFPDFWGQLQQHFEALHDSEKQQFFSLLPKPVIDRYEPKY